jgi:hypothetical protein
MAEHSIGSRVGRAALVVLATAALALQGGAAWGVSWVITNERHLKDQLVAYQFEAPEEILSYARQSGMSPTGELYFMTSLPQIVPVYEFDRYCTRNEPGIGVLGCYTLRDGRIYLYDVTDDRLASIEPVVAAHEMLHSAWARLSGAEQEGLAKLLEEGFATLPSDHQLRDRIASYEADNPASRIPELYSILGTEVAPLPALLEEHYAIYFDDRSKVVALADELYRVFDTVEAELSALAQELESRAAEIEGLRFAYEAEQSNLNAAVLSFNDRASQPGAFPSRSEFESTRNALVERQSRLESMRVSLQTKITEYNERLEELNRLNSEVSELNQGINVRLREEEELSPQDTDLEQSSFGFRGAGGCCGIDVPLTHDLILDHGFAARSVDYYREQQDHHRCDYWAKPLT